MDQERTATTTLTPKPWGSISTCWPEMIPVVLRQWPRVTYMDALSVAGRRHHLCTLLGERYGVTHDEADDMVWTWQTSLGRPRRKRDRDLTLAR